MPSLNAANVNQAYMLKPEPLNPITHTHSLNPEPQVLQTEFDAQSVVVPGSSAVLLAGVWRLAESCSVLSLETCLSLMF